MNRIFLITPGRSGTYWLSALILASTNLPLTGNPEFFPYEKIEADSERRKFVDTLLSSEGMPSDYVCTSLLPRMGFLDLLSENGARFIHLKRDIRANAYSMYKMHFAPGRGFRGIWYHPNPEATENVIRLRATPNLTDYQLCLWACIETRSVAKRIRGLGVDMFEFDIDEINSHNDYTLLTGLLDWIGVEYDLDRAKMMIGKRMNSLDRYAKDLLPDIEEGLRRDQERFLLDCFKDLLVATQVSVDEVSVELGL